MPPARRHGDRHRVACARGSRPRWTSRSPWRPTATRPSRTCPRTWSATAPTSTTCCSAGRARSPARVRGRRRREGRRAPITTGSRCSARSTRLGHPFDEIGVPAYPEGHPDIADDRLQAVLAQKQPFADYMTTQMCFDPDAIVGVDRADAGAGRDAAGARGHAGRGGAQEADDDQRAHRRGGLGALPEEEPVDGGAPALARALRARRAARGPGAVAGRARRSTSRRCTSSRSTRSRPRWSGSSGCSPS